MLSIKLVCVGNLKERFWMDACDEYKKRLSKFCKLTVVEIEEQNRLKETDKILHKEGEDILKHLSGTVVLMAIEGKQYSSEEFSAFIETQKLTTSELTFVIGGSYGVSEEVKRSIKTKVSFGKATFPHNLARVMLLEQLYRGFMLASGSSYHK